MNYGYNSLRGVKYLIGWRWCGRCGEWRKVLGLLCPDCHHHLRRRKRKHSDFDFGESKLRNNIPIKNKFVRASPLKRPRMAN